MGVTLDYAPVLDVLTNAKNPAIGDRALADDVELVSELGRVIITELQDAGIAACGKHFPGHGDTSVDSHHELPLVEHPPDRLRAIEFRPFEAAIAAEVASIITAHMLVPSLDAGMAGDALAPHRDRHPPQGAALRGRHLHGRHGDAGGRGALAGAGGLRAGGRGRVRRRSRVQRKHGAAVRDARGAHSRGRGRALAVVADRRQPRCATAG